MRQRWFFAAITIAVGLAGKTALAQDDSAMQPAEVDFAAQAALAPPNSVTFNLVASPAILDCLRASPNVTPKATATVTRGEKNDTLTILVENIKPFLAFDMFTVERSPFLADGKPDPNFKANFGMAWYQSDLRAGPKGRATATIQTILLDQIFGFDPTVGLKPTNTFHLGFWFNNPEDARACGFDVTKPTPFNGEHRAGPVAMITLPKADSKLGPLCTDPDFSTNPVSCHP